MSTAMSEKPIHTLRPTYEMPKRLTVVLITWNEKKRLETFKNYQIDAKLASLADKNYIFMHCLPAHRGQEVTEEVIDGPHSIIFDEAENRLHVQKAILIFLYKNSTKSRGKK